VVRTSVCDLVRSVSWSVVSWRIWLMVEQWPNSMTIVLGGSCTRWHVNVTLEDRMWGSMLEGHQRFVRLIRGVRGGLGHPLVLGCDGDVTLWAVSQFQFRFPLHVSPSHTNPSPSSSCHVAYVCHYASLLNNHSQPASCTNGSYLIYVQMRFLLSFPPFPTFLWSFLFIFY